jgi:hypothetical protein
MTIKVVIKRTRINQNVTWYNRDANGKMITPITLFMFKNSDDTDSGVLSLDIGADCTLDRDGKSLHRTPDNLTVIATRVWEDLDAYKSSMGNADEIRSENSEWTAYMLAEGAYNEDNNITLIRYIYDADDTLISRQKRINNESIWEDYSE